VQPGNQLIWSAFPLLLFPIIAFNLIVLLNGTNADQILELELFGIIVASGDIWHLTMRDLLLSSALVMLFIEVLRAADIERNTLTNHGLSTGVLIFALIEFVALPGFANGDFFLLVLITLIDVVAGYSITIRAALRDIAIG
jgi:hypothetical protein